MILDTEAAILANFNYLVNQHDDRQDMEEDEDDVEEELYETNPESKENKVIVHLYTTFL